jgi:hypothetical protein
MPHVLLSPEQLKLGYLHVTLPEQLELGYHIRHPHLNRWSFDITEVISLEQLGA